MTFKKVKYIGCCDICGIASENLNMVETQYGVALVCNAYLCNKEINK